MAVTICRLTREPIDATELLNAVSASGDGAVLLFWGVVRDHNEGRAVRHLDYDAYPGMAEGVLQEITAEVRERWPVGGIAIVHRVGRLEIGEASVGIALASPHRADAYEASRYMIEELKRRVPIWKREGYVDGEDRWLGGEAVTGEAPAEAARRGER